MGIKQMDYEEVRCKGRRNGKICNKLIAREALEAGEVELQCPRCGTYLTLRASRPNPALHDSLSGDCHVYTISSHP